MADVETVLITGASRGIGRATAIQLGAEGADVIVNYHESPTAASEVVDAIEDSGSRAISVEADVSDVEDVKELFEEGRSAFGPIDGLVNNAGVILRPSSWTDIDQETWWRTLEVNLFGVFNCIRAVAPEMQAAERGKIVNVSSTYAMLGAAPVIAYTAAKAGVLNLTKSFAVSLSPYINVNAVAFGHIDTDMTAAADEIFVEEVVEETPLERLGTPEEAAEIIQFLLGESSDFITGEILVADGGHRL